VAADNRVMRILLPSLLVLVLVPSALAASPRTQSITGTVSANSGSSITVTSGDRSVTCAVVGATAQAALTRWGTGVRAAMRCKRDGDHLVLFRLKRLDAHEGTQTTPTTTDSETETTGTTTHDSPTTTTAPTQTRSDARGRVSALGGGAITVTRDGGTSLTCTVTDGQARSIAEGAPVGTAVLIVCVGDGDRPALLNLQRLETSTPPSTTTSPTTTTTAAPPSTDRRYAKGLVTALSSDGVTVKPDEGGDSLGCRITGASDSAAAAAKLTLGAHVGIVCRRDGDSWVLAGATLLG